MSTESYKLIELKNYKVPNFLIESVNLCFQLEESYTKVRSNSIFYRNKKSTDDNNTLILSGISLELVSLKIDGVEVARNQYDLTANNLSISNPPERFELEITTKVYPDKNKTLMGLYKSGGMFCTQCEAEGFRRITYFLDRPDVLTIYTTRIEADKNKYPLLLSNGNITDSGDLPDGKHFKIFHDPFKKPSYLFALVAGDLAVHKDSFTTKSGKNVDLAIYVEHGQENKTFHAMDSLKKSMKWDEDVYNLEYDLDVFSIVAVSDFNFGAMENKSLNIFNSQYILADVNTATDQNFESILSIIGHEYFHNWTGNRVTCRDWFQLSLKEGLTVYRDSVFTEDMTSKSAVRIESVQSLRTHQFAEDASPISHPVRPESYMEIDNFYTMTIYEKGAEIIRMYHTLLGEKLFKKGIDLYFQRHDGQAVTIEDFTDAMATASGIDLTDFKKWYSQAGTPKVSIDGSYNQNSKEFLIRASQMTPPTHGQIEKTPLVIPIKTALISKKSGKEIPFKQKGSNQEKNTDQILVLSSDSQEFILEGVSEDCIPSYLRGFSAPIKLETSFLESELGFLMTHDSDGFNQFEAIQKFAQKINIKNIENTQNQRDFEISSTFLESIDSILNKKNHDPKLLSLLLTMPSSKIILNSIEENADIEAIFHSCSYLKQKIASEFKDKILQLYLENSDGGTFSSDLDAIAKRSLKNICLGYLVSLNDPQFLNLCIDQYDSSTNMTDRINALTFLCDLDSSHRQEKLQNFYERYQSDSLVLNKWFGVQSGSHHKDALNHTEKLLDHQDFDYLNPNKIRTLFGRFTWALSPYGIHHKSGRGYELIGKYILKLDSKNPSVAASLTKSLTSWRSLHHKHGSNMKMVLERIKNSGKLSKNVFEIVSKGLE